MWTYPKCQCTKPGIWKLWISKKKCVRFVAAGDGIW